MDPLGPGYGLAFPYAVNGCGFARAYMTPEEFIAESVLDAEPLFPAGEGYHYSDVHYTLAGLAIEEASGREYYDLLDEFFLDPFELDLTLPATRTRVPGSFRETRGWGDTGLLGLRGHADCFGAAAQSEPKTGRGASTASPSRSRSTRTIRGWATTCLSWRTW